MVAFNLSVTYKCTTFARFISRMGRRRDRLYEHIRPKRAKINGR